MLKYYLKRYVKRKNGVIMLFPLKFDENLPPFAFSYFIILKTTIFGPSCKFVFE